MLVDFGWCSENSLVQLHAQLSKELRAEQLPDEVVGCFFWKSTSHEPVMVVQG